eukprot:260497-Prymnesium_polylepis.1
MRKRRRPATKGHDGRRAELVEYRLLVGWVRRRTLIERRMRDPGSRMGTATGMGFEHNCWWWCASCVCLSRQIFHKNTESADITKVTSEAKEVTRPGQTHAPPRVARVAVPAEPEAQAARRGAARPTMVGPRAPRRFCLFKTPFYTKDSHLQITQNGPNTPNMTRPWSVATGTDRDTWTVPNMHVHK